MPQQTSMTALQPLVGRWMTLGTTSTDEAAARIAASDVYEWAPGGRFLIHSAYGVIGEDGVGGVEIIGQNTRRKGFTTWFFDSQGGVEEQTLTVRGRTWKWLGALTRCVGLLSADGHSMPCQHEASDGSGGWTPTMAVTLIKVR